MGKVEGMVASKWRHLTVPGSNPARGGAKHKVVHPEKEEAFFVKYWQEN